MNWIPTSKEIPPKGLRVILSIRISNNDRWTVEGYFWEKTEDHAVWKALNLDTYWDDEVVAWAHMPAPYEEEAN